MRATIREARAGEEAAIAALYEWLFAPPGSKPPQWDPKRATAALAQAIAAPDSAVLVAEEGATLVGLCTAACAWARERGATHLALDSGLGRTDAHRFYERRDPDLVGYCYSWWL